MTAQQSHGLLILGMHRSGTSALAGALHTAGWFFGEQLLPSTADFNPKGFFEDQRIVAIHDELLASLGLRWYNCHLLPPDWMSSAGAGLAKQKLLALLSAEFLSKPRWAVKDPRLSVLLPLWHDVLETLGVTFQCLVLLRHPAEVVASLARRNQFAQDLGFLNWLTYSLAAEFGSRTVARQFVQYEELVAAPEVCLSACLAQLGHLDALSEEVLAHITPDLRHHHGQEQALPDLVAAAYKALREVSHKQAAQSVLDDICSQLQTFVPLLPNTVALESAYLQHKHTAELTRQHVESLESAVQHWIDEHQQRLSDIAHWVEQHRQRVQEAEQFGAKLNVQSQVLAAAEENLRETTARLQSERAQGLIALHERDQLAQHLSRAEADFQAVVNSQVWRWSRPVRALVETIRQVHDMARRRLAAGEQKVAAQLGDWRDALWAEPHQLALKPYQGIGLKNGDFVCHGPRPLFLLVSSQGFLPTGRVLLSFDVPHCDRLLAPRVYLFRAGEAAPQIIDVGKTASHSYRASLKISGDVVRLGLEPFDGDGQLAVDNVQLKQVLFVHR